MDDQTKLLRGGAVEVCPECDIAGCRHIRARAALAAQPVASESYAERMADDLADAIFEHFKTPAGSEGDESAWDHALAVIKAAQPAASAEPSDEEIEALAHRVCTKYTHADDPSARRYEFGMLTLRQFARALLSRYGRPAGDAQPPVGYVHLVPDEFSKSYDVRFWQRVPIGTKLYAAPVAAHKPDGGDAKDAERYRWLLSNYAFGDGYTAIDSALNDGEADVYLSAAIDAAIAQQRKGGK